MATTRSKLCHECGHDELRRLKEAKRDRLVAKFEMSGRSWSLGKCRKCGRSAAVADARTWGAA